MIKRAIWCCALSGLGVIAAWDACLRVAARLPNDEDRTVRSTVNGALAVADGNLLHPVGDVVSATKPLDVEAAPDGSLLFVKSWKGVTIFNPKTFRPIATLSHKRLEGSMHGLAVVPAASGNGWTVYYTCIGPGMVEAHVAADGAGELDRAIPLPKGHNWGIAISPDGNFAYVCMSEKIRWGLSGLAEGKLIQEIPVGVAPYDIAISPDGKSAYVTNLGGGRPVAGDSTAKSLGTEVAVDKRSIPLRGSVSKLDLKTCVVVGEIKVGLHPTQIIRDSKGSRYFVANANSDSI